MSKFVKILMTYILIVAVAVVGINTWYIALDTNDSTWTKKFESVPDNIQICSFGSSHGLYGYNYEDLDEEYTCFNFALDSQRLSYDARIMKQYQDKLQEDAVVFITISYFSFYGIDETKEADFASKNLRYYHFLQKELIKEYEFKTALYENWFPALSAYDELPEVLLGQRRNAEETYKIWEESAENIDVNENAARAYQRHLIDNKLDEQGERIYNQIEVDALYEMIAMCRSVGAIPVLIITPYLEEYPNAVQSGSPEFFEEFYERLDLIASDTGVEYFDYSGDVRFSQEYSLFMNPDHLNKEGARRFTNILKEEVLEHVRQN